MNVFMLDPTSSGDVVRLVQLATYAAGRNMNRTGVDWKRCVCASVNEFLLTPMGFEEIEAMRDAYYAGMCDESDQT